MQPNQTSDLSLEVITNVEKHYFGQATSNRIKRELRELYAFEREGIELENPYYMSAALIIPYGSQEKQITCTERHLTTRFKLRLDFQFPFNHPQLQLAQPNSLAGQGRDLFSLLLRPQEKWQSAMSLIDFLPKLPELANRIRQNKTELMGIYHQFECYGQDELKQHNLTIFKVVERQRRMLVTHQRVDKQYRCQLRLLAFGRFVVLKFGYHENLLRLEFWEPIKNVLHVFSDLEKKELQLIYLNKCKETALKLYDVTDLDEVLLRLNPAQMLEHRILQAEKTNTVDQALLRDYTELIALLSASEETQSRVSVLVKKMSQASARVYASK